MTTENTLNQIAKEHLGLETLATRRADGLDFHDLAVWSVKAALQAAFGAGQAAASKKPRKGAKKAVSKAPGAAEYAARADKVQGLVDRLVGAVERHGKAAAAAAACWGHSGDLTRTEQCLVEALFSLGGLTAEEQAAHGI